MPLVYERPIVKELVEFKRFKDSLSPYLNNSIGSYDVANHLFRLVSGLESMIIGEFQIVEQLKDAYYFSKKHKMLGPILKRMIQKSLETLKLVNLEGYENRMPSELSGGQQQRVAVARAIVLEPKVLLFDEPLSNLDAKLRRQVREDIREIQQKLGVTTIYVTHDQEEALAISDKVIVMNNAVIAQEGSPKDLYNFPQNKFVANFIGDANVVKAEILNKQSNSYDLKIAEMNIKVQSDKDFEKTVSVALRPEKISINKDKKENSIHATVSNASFVGSSYQYILNSNAGKLFVISGETNDIFKVGEEVFLSINDQDVKILND